MFKSYDCCLKLMEEHVLEKKHNTQNIKITI